MNPALVIIVLFALFALAVGLYARRGKTFSLEQWAVGGRGFGSLLTFLLMAGEAFSTFSFLGARPLFSRPRLSPSPPLTRVSSRCSSMRWCSSRSALRSARSGPVSLLPSNRHDHHDSLSSSLQRPAG